jgi:hypothetical protein
MNRSTNNKELDAPLIEREIATPQDDDGFLENLKGLAHATRLVWQLGHVQIDSGDDAEPERPLSEDIKARLQKVWPQLSREDQETLSNGSRSGKPRGLNGSVNTPRANRENQQLARA